MFAERQAREDRKEEPGSAGFAALAFPGPSTNRSIASPSSSRGSRFAFTAAMPDRTGGKGENQARRICQSIVRSRESGVKSRVGSQVDSRESSRLDGDAATLDSPLLTCLSTADYRLSTP